MKSVELYDLYTHQTYYINPTAVVCIQPWEQGVVQFDAKDEEMKPQTRVTVRHFQGTAGELCLFLDESAADVAHRWEEAFA